MLKSIFIFIAVTSIIAVIIVFTVLFKNIMNVQEKSEQERLHKTESKIEEQNKNIK